MKTHSKLQDILSLVPLLNIDELYDRLNGLTVYSLLNSTLGYHHIALSPKAQIKSVFFTPIEKFEMKKVPFGLAQGPPHFH